MKVIRHHPSLNSHPLPKRRHSNLAMRLEATQNLFELDNVEQNLIRTEKRNTGLQSIIIRFANRVI
jgi:predicted Zn-dependent protease